MELRVLHHALQHRREHRLHFRILRQLLQGAVHEIVELFLELIDVAAALADDPHHLAVVQQGVEQVLQGDVLVTTAYRVVQGELEGLL